MRLHLRLLPALTPLAGTLVLAQTETIIDRANQRPPSLPTEAAPPAAPATPGADSDAGVQRIAEPRRLPFRLDVALDQQLYVASNVFLSPRDKPDNDTGALVSVSTLSLGAETLPLVVGRGRLTWSAALLWQRTLHGLATSDPLIQDLDFDSWSLPLAATYRWGRGWEASAGLTIGSVYSIGDAPSHELLYRSHSPAVSLRKTLRLSDGALLSLGTSISYADTQASLHEVPAGLAYRQDRNDRLDASASVSLYLMDGPWSLSPALRVSHGHYLHWEEGGPTTQDRAQDRDDLFAGASLTAGYTFADWGSARLFASYDLRSSSGGVVDYDYGAGSVGLGCSIGLRF